MACMVCLVKDRIIECLDRGHLLAEGRSHRIGSGDEQLNMYVFQSGR